MEKMLQTFSSFRSGYTPTVWCFPATLNTCVYIKVQLNGELNYERELLDLPDGGVLALDWANLGNKNRLIVLVLPGLTGCSQDNYVSHMVQKAEKLSCLAVVMNYRGNQVELRTPRTFCAVNYDDVHFVVSHIRKKYKDHKILAIGLSMGGLKLAGYLAKHNNPCLLSYAMVVSSPMNLSDATEELEKVHNYMFFNYYLTRRINMFFSKLVKKIII
jgi:abhydrolase domain-containing protein 1/3